MRLHPRCVVVLMVLLVPATAQAHLHVWDVGFGPAAATGSTLLGGRVSIGLTTKKPTNKNLSVLIDLTNLKDEENGQHTTHLAYLAGGRWALFSNEGNIFMVHGLGGIAHRQQGATAKTDWPVTVGAAYERALGTYTSGEARWAARVQVEHSFFPFRDKLERYTQYSASFVRRFE